jgi:hypothetical protein
MGKRKPRVSAEVSILYEKLCAIKNIASKGATEATIRQLFCEAVTELLQQVALDDCAPLPLQYMSLEEPVARSRHRSDARIGAIVFEFKKPKPHGEGIEAAVTQGKKYIRMHAEAGERFHAACYDGENIALLDEKGEVAYSGDLLNGALTLESWLILLGGKVATPEDMVSRLGFASPAARTLIVTLFNILEEFSSKIPIVDEIFQVWRGVYGCAANLNKDAIAGFRRSANALDLQLASNLHVERYVFTLQTYLSILLKMLVARVAAQQRLVRAATVVELIADPQEHIAQRFARLSEAIPKIANIFEEDVFNWFGEAAARELEIENRLGHRLRNIAEQVDSVDVTRLSTDFLRLFYQRFFDPASRRALGEFYTSPEIIRECLTAIEFEGKLDGKLLDMACGSGAFLVEAIAQIIAAGKTKKKHLLLGQITENVIGFDIHPLAVAIARVNYILSISGLLEPGNLELLGQIRVPIYWADSLIRLAHKVQQRNLPDEHHGRTVTVEIPKLDRFTLPHPEEISWDRLFQATRAAMKRWRPGMKRAEIWQRFLQEFPEPERKRFEDVLQRFLMGMLDRHEAGRDMRWLPLMHNVLGLEELRGGCKYVVGNPPWIRIHNIEEVLRKRVYEDYEFCKRAGWQLGCRLADIGRGFARQIDYCVPFVERGIEMLAPAGRLSFVITSKIVQALYGNELRCYILKQTKLLRIADYSLLAVPLFEDATNYPLIFGIENSPPDEKHKTDITVYNALGEKKHFRIPQRDLSIVKNDPESPWAIAPPQAVAAFHKMAQNTMRMGDCDESRPRMGVKTALNEAFFVKSLSATDNPDYLLAVTATETHERIPKKFLRPVLRGENISEWSYSVTQFIIWTHDDSRGNVLSDLPERLKSYFEDPVRAEALKKREDFHKGMPIWTIFRVSPDKLMDKVAWCELSHTMEAVYVPKKFRHPLLGPQLLVPIQTAYLIPAEKEKAFALAGLLNSLPLRAFFASFSERARGAYFRHFAWTVGLAPLPRAWLKLLDIQYNDPPADAASFERVQRTSEALHKCGGVDPKGKLREELDQAVARAYGLTDAEFSAMREYLEFVQRRIEAQTKPTIDENSPTLEI